MHAFNVVGEIHALTHWLPQWFMDIPSQPFAVDVQLCTGSVEERLMLSIPSYLGKYSVLDCTNISVHVISFKMPLHSPSDACTEILCHERCCFEQKL